MLDTATSRRCTTRCELLADVGNARIHGGVRCQFSVNAGIDIAELIVRLKPKTNFRPAR